MAHRLSDKQKAFLETFEKSATNVSTACKKAGITRKTYYRWMNTNDTLKERVEDIRESMIDFAESMLYKNMKAGKETSTLFFLKTRGKSRGYVEKQEIEMNANVNMTSDEVTKAVAAGLPD